MTPSASLLAWHKTLSFCVVLLFSLSSNAWADYLPLNGAEVANNIAEIHITDDGVRVQLEIFIDDAKQFEDLIPDQWFAADVSARPSAAERLSNFSETGLSVRRGGGRALPVRITRVEQRMRVDRTTPLTGLREPITGRFFPSPPDDPRVVYVELFYDFEAAQPEVIEIAPPVDAHGAPRATIGFITFDRGVPVANFAYLSGPARLGMDWDDPWYSKFDSVNLRRHHKSGVTTYLYIEPRELRHETLIRVRDIDPWLDLNLTSGQHLSPQQQSELKAKAGSFLAGRNPVSIDGDNVVPESYRTELLTLNTTGLQVVGPEQDIGADEAFLGVILSFPWQTLPENVSVQWDMFNEVIAKVPATSTDPAGPFLSGATVEDPKIAWRNHLRTYQNPTVTPLPVGAIGQVALPILSILLVATALGAGFVATRTHGMPRLLAVGFSVVSIGGAVVGVDRMTIDVRNPLSRVPEAAQATEAFSLVLAAVNAANLEVDAPSREIALSPIVVEAAQAEVAAELDRALAVRVPGGGVARVTDVNDVRLSDIGPLESGFGFRALAEWSARAKAGHWGHTHHRAIEYRALIEIQDVDGFWSLSGITVLEAKLPDA